MILHLSLYATESANRNDFGDLREGQPSRVPSLVVLTGMPGNHRHQVLAGWQWPPRSRLLSLADDRA